MSYSRITPVVITSGVGTVSTGLACGAFLLVSARFASIVARSALKMVDILAMMSFRISSRSRVKPLWNPMAPPTASSDWMRVAVKELSPLKAEAALPKKAKSAHSTKTAKNI
eukprot:Blabericola_migrator_1__3199@NODE_193_length_11571_cov_33_434805_g166_i0_p9_GENE_NODE_193_length_11571_cov_33_434805_g166_i0NODE_193_length_11571_cov_33_434805_g166_i0_p9_ORF_typecomplete_len112_score24_34RhoGEF67_u2/PF16614_5/0_14_NODE_193_length_11571_cov_33_434805_g166_i042174552